MSQIEMRNPEEIIAQIANHLRSINQISMNLRKAGYIVRFTVEGGYRFPDGNWSDQVVAKVVKEIPIPPHEIIL